MSDPSLDSPPLLADSAPDQQQLEASTDSESATRSASLERVLTLLRRGRMKVEGLLPHSSNYTFLVTLRQPDMRCLGVYKPQKGERPLWDFPRGTLCLREYAAYHVSMAMGWLMVPPTVLRRGPHGLGAVQLYVDSVDGGNFFSLREHYAPLFKRLCAFDYVVNNADRKGGHCLLGKDERVWAIDHGIAFHSEFKLRTVIWDWAGEPLPDDVRAGLLHLQQKLADDRDLSAALRKALRDDEMTALRERLAALLESNVFPEPTAGLPNIPWPLI